jgi:Fe2+ transport system protein FeoA
MGDKEEMDVSALRARKDRLERRIMDMGANRDANESARVTDVSGWGAPWWNRLPPP